jgi:hypothetical protein
LYRGERKPNPRGEEPADPLRNSLMLRDGEETLVSGYGASSTGEIGGRSDHQGEIRR